MSTRATERGSPPPPPKKPRFWYRLSVQYPEIVVVKQRIAGSASFVAVCILCISCHREAKVATERVKDVAPEKHLAPDGTFFLTQRVSVTTNSGVTGIAPGSKVILIASDGDKLRVTDGTTEIVVHQSQVTNDVDIARSLAAADHQMQEQVANAVAQQQREYERRRAEEQAALAREQESRPRSAHALGQWNNPLNKPVYNRTQDKKYLDSNGKTYWIDVQGRRHYDN